MNMIQWGTQFYKDMIEFWKKINRKEANILPFEYESVDPIFKRTELHSVYDTDESLWEPTFKVIYFFFG